MSKAVISDDLLKKMDAYWRAANYLSVGQIYLRDNPLLRRPLEMKDIKKMLLGHWGTTPGQNFIYVHLNRVIKENDLDMIYISGPGHGGPALMGNTYLEGTWSEVYPDMPQNEDGMKVMFHHPVTGIAPGQSAVFYEGDDVIGGGFINKPSKNIF